jgi:hypothetical protein
MTMRVWARPEFGFGRRGAPDRLRLDEKGSGGEEGIRTLETLPSLLP